MTPQIFSRFFWNGRLAQLLGGLGFAILMSSSMACGEPPAVGGGVNEDWFLHCLKAVAARG